MSSHFIPSSQILVIHTHTRTINKYYKYKMHSLYWCLCLSPMLTLTLYRKKNFFCLQCFDTVGWAAGRASDPQKILGDGGGGHWLVRNPDGVMPSWMVSVSASVNLPLHHKVQKFSSGTGSPGWSQKRAVKWLWCF